MKTLSIPAAPQSCKRGLRWRRTTQGEFFSENFRPAACSYDFYSYLCNALHLNKATVSPSASAAGLFCGRDSRHTHSSVPCGALMRPLPCSRCNATGSGTFFVPNPGEIINFFSYSFI